MVEKSKKGLLVVAVVLGIVAMVMIFCPSISLEMFWYLDEWEYSMNASLSGTETVFGYEIEMFDWEYGNQQVVGLFKFSFFMLLTYLLPLAGIITLFFAKKNNYFYYATIFCFIVAAILFFLSPSLVVWGNSSLKNELKERVELGAGAIIGGLSCIIATLCVYAYTKEKVTVTGVEQEK